MGTATAPASPPKGGVVQRVKSIFQEVVQREADAVARAREAYPRLLELEDADPRHVAELQEAMRLLGKTAADITADLATIQEGRRLQGVIRHGSGLDAAREAATKALADHDAETTRIAEERRRQHFELLAVETELGNRYGYAQQASHQLSRMKLEHAEAMRYVERPELT